MKILCIALVALSFGCAVDAAEEGSVESPSVVEQGLSRCITDPGQVFPWLCVWDHNTPGVYSDDVASRDIAAKDGRTDCYRIELVNLPATDDCFLSKGYRPGGGASARQTKLLVRDNYGELDRTFKHWHYESREVSCPTRVVNTCSL